MAASGNSFPLLLAARHFAVFSELWPFYAASNDDKVWRSLARDAARRYDAVALFQDAFAVLVEFPRYVYLRRYP